MSTTETNDHAAPPVETPYSKASYRYFVLGVLTLVYIVIALLGVMLGLGAGMMGGGHGMGVY